MATRQGTEPPARIRQLFILRGPFCTCVLACVPVGHGVVDAAVLGEDGLLFFQHQNLLAEHPGAYRGPRERARDDEAALAVGVCQGDGGGEGGDGRISPRHPYLRHERRLLLGTDKGVMPICGAFCAAATRAVVD